MTLKASLFIRPSKTTWHGTVPPIFMAEKLFAVKGMNDILPPDSARWEWFEDTVRALMRRYGYLNVRTPVVEPTPLFVRGLGEVTDIVEKEMYSWTDSMNGDALTLRPEGTAGVVRAAIEHSMLYEGGKRLYYIGPMFRHERPQRGRYRQFHQVGVEAMGFGGPDVDAEVILMCRSLWRDLGLEDVRLDINCLGQSSERKAHREALIAHLELGRELLDAAGQPYRVNHRLVRGMDYYSLTVFEWVTDRLGAQGTVCGGGRYDGLSELMGGKPAPGIGWGMGIERVLDLLQQTGVAVPMPVPDVYAVVPSAEALPMAMKIAEDLRAAGVSVLMHAAGKDSWGSMKSQFKRADASGARHALIFGAEELARGEVALKRLREASAGSSSDTPSAQSTRELRQVAAWAAELRNA